MGKAHITSTETVVRDPKSGRFVTVRGVGALKDRLTIDERIDLTKPIAAQAVKIAKRSANRPAPVKR